MGTVTRTFFRGVRSALTPAMLAFDRFGKPTPVERSAEAQAEVDRACQDLTLYQFRTCPFCVKVRHEIHRLALPIALRDTREDPAAKEALQAGGGRTMVPCLAIAGEGSETRWLYESEEIKRYLRHRFEPASTG
ncbi:glutaredoxin family protein [Kushneria aurantia]|uniref:Glutaredoxin family protein n=1 Tax=Kushneria aurantia TaxID=504092 RepID=A0ABV6FZ26_9GAMM|nr:glutaredoxin [Kushneria aurantia]